MYVIFPADEVVYLSYGRLIYVPYAPTPDNRLNAPIRTSDEEDVDNIAVTPPPGSNPPTPRKTSSEITSVRPNDRPGPSGVNSLERSKKTVKTKPPTPLFNNTDSNPPYQGSLDRPRQFRARTPERAFATNSNKSSKSSKQSSSSSKSKTAVKEKNGPEVVQLSSRQRTSSESATSKPSSSKLSSNSFRDFLRPSKNKDKSTDSPPLRPERKKEKKQVSNKTSERKLSYSDYLTVSRERTEIPRSNIINTRSDQCEHVTSVKQTVKREKSPVIRFFRAQSSSPRNIPRERDVFNFERDPSPGKLSSSSVPRLRAGLSSDSNLLSGPNTATSEKAPTKKRGFFSSLRVKKPSDTAEIMAVNESPLKDLIHPSYNEHLKSHNAVTFKLVRTGHVDSNTET